MNTNLDYIRTFLGERGNEDPLLTDAELSALMSLSILLKLPERLCARMAMQGVACTRVSSDGLLRFTLKPLAHAPNEFHAGIGNWLDGACAIRIGSVSYEPAENDVIDSFGGRIIFAETPPPGAVTVETYLIDLRAALIEVLCIIKASHSRLSLKTNLAGMSVDLTGICAGIQAEIDALSTGYELPFTASEDFPH
jgi:hypothetical protein